MAIRNIVKEGDPILNKVCRPVTTFDDRLATLLDDMHETMIAADGVGLAGPQVGMLRRLFVVWDTTDAPEEIPEGLYDPVGVVAQTTQRRENLEAVVAALREAGLEPIVKNTICSATRQRQEAAADLASAVDAMVVIGGLRSIYGTVIGALIVIALTLLYTWDKVLKLVLMLLGKLPHTPKWDERREKWANSLTELNREAKKVLLVPSIRVKGIAVSLVKLFVLYSIPYAALRLVGCTALNFAQAQMLASLMLLITSALPNVAGVGPMEFAFLLLFAPWADTAIASSALVLYRVATYFFPFLLSVIVFLREEKKSLKGFDAQSA